MSKDAAFIRSSRLQNGFAFYRLQEPTSSYGGFCDQSVVVGCQIWSAVPGVGLSSSQNIALKTEILASSIAKNSIRSAS